MPENWKSRNWDSLISGELCPVCDLVHSDAKEDEHLMRVCDLPLSRLYLAKNQFVRGYCVLICQRHVIELYELSSSERAAYFDDVALAASALQKVFAADKMNYNILGNLSPHLHTHILPRYFTDNAPNRPIDPALKGHEIFLTTSEYKERINLISDQIHTMKYKNMITIGYLIDHRDTIPTLAKWFREQWPDYYADWSQAEMEQDFLEDASRDRLPVRLVAFEAGELAGTIILRENGSESQPEFQPELGGLYVVASQRGHGIGTELIRAGMKLAQDLGYETIHAKTVAAAGILERLGWEFVKTVEQQDGQTALYRYKPNAQPNKA